MEKNYVIQVDTIEFDLTGMSFDNPSPSEATVLNKETGEVKMYGNRVFLQGKGKSKHRMSVRLMDSGRLRFSGSPYAFRYGQNMFTASDILRAVSIVIKRAIIVLGINPPQELLDRWLSGDVDLLRVDLAVNYRLATEADVLTVLTQVRRQLIEQDGPTRTSGSTVYWDPQEGKKYSICFYAKGPQMRRAKRYQGMDCRDQLITEAENILRVEIRLRRADLKKLGQLKVSDWKKDTAEKIFEQYLAKLNLMSVTSGSVTNKELSELPSRLRPVLALHKAGEDLNRIYEPRTMQRHIKDFRDLGIDLKCPNQQQGSITSLSEYLSLDKAISDLPKWMVDAKLVPTSEVKSVGTEQVQSCESSNVKTASVAYLDEVITFKRKKGKKFL